MEKHTPLDSTLKDLDNILSRVNGLEVSSTDEYQRATVSVLKTLVQGEINLFKEFEHLKKAIDLVTLEMFKIKNKN
tara:strand:- start:1834 stop:2061 length:228 start_codon:yes stop_codon:yes gene_type:complete